MSKPSQNIDGYVMPPPARRPVSAVQPQETAAVQAASEVGVQMPVAAAAPPKVSRAASPTAASTLGQQVYGRAQQIYHEHLEDTVNEIEERVGTYAAQMKGKTGVRRIVNALGYSWDGVKSACTEQGFRQLLWVNGICFILTWVLPFSLGTQLALILISCINLMIELVNTGIEAAVDHTSQEKHELAKRAKDVGSAAQYLTLFVLILMWITALWRTFVTHSA